MKVIFAYVFLIFGFSILTQAQSWQWVKLEYGWGDNENYDHVVTSDDSGNIYSIAASVVGPNSLSKFDRNGNPIWHSGSSNFYGSTKSVAIANGAEFIAGDYYYSPQIFGNDTLRPNGSNYETYLVKFNPAGGVEWAVQTKSPKNTDGPIVSSIAADELGNVYVTGLLTDTSIFDNDTVFSILAEPFIAKYSSAGVCRWVRVGIPHGSSSAAYIKSIASDSIGNTYITGNFKGTMIFGRDTISDRYASKRCLFIVKCDSSGNINWAKNAQMSSSKGTSFGWSISADGSGNSYVTGAFYCDTMSIGGYSIGSASEYGSPFLVKLKPGGSVSWLMFPHEDSSYYVGKSISVDKSHTGYVMLDNSGFTKSGLITFGSDTFRFDRIGFIPSILVQFDTSGRIECGDIFTEGTENDGDGLCVSPNGKYAYIMADILDTGFFDTISLIPASLDELVLGRWNCDANIDGVKMIDNLNNQVNLYPNPSIGRFELVNNSPLTVLDKYKIEIFNVFGQCIRTVWIGSQITTIDLISQPNGIYFYRVCDEKGVIWEGKLVVEK